MIVDFYNQVTSKFPYYSTCFEMYNLRFHMVKTELSLGFLVPFLVLIGIVDRKFLPSGDNLHVMRCIPFSEVSHGEDGIIGFVFNWHQWYVLRCLPLRGVNGKANFSNEKWLIPNSVQNYYKKFWKINALGRNWTKFWKWSLIVVEELHLAYIQLVLPQVFVLCFLQVVFSCPSACCQEKVCAERLICQMLVYNHSVSLCILTLWSDWFAFPS